MTHKLLAIFHSSTFLWSPDNSISGTFNPLKSDGLVYECPFNLPELWLSLATESSFPITPGIFLRIESITTDAAISPPLKT